MKVKSERKDAEVKSALKALLDEHDFEFSDDPDTEEKEVDSMLERCRQFILSLIESRSKMCNLATKASSSSSPTITSKT